MVKKFLKTSRKRYNLLVDLKLKIFLLLTYCFHR